MGKNPGYRNGVCTCLSTSYSDNIISKSSENPELVAPNFGDEIKYLSEIELGTMVKKFIF